MWNGSETMKVTQQCAYKCDLMVTDWDSVCSKAVELFLSKV